MNGCHTIRNIAATNNSVKAGRFDHANSFLPNAEQTEAAREPLEYPQETRGELLG